VFSRAPQVAPRISSPFPAIQAGVVKSDDAQQGADRADEWVVSL
jgi:hypothetical protein